MIKKLFLFFCFFIIVQFAFAQPANDNCSGAISLGTLGNPANCTPTGGIKNGSSSTVSSSLNSATPESPYTTLTGCAGGTMASPANDVWYSFTMPANGYQVNIIISGAAFTPNIALWQGSCAALTGRGCTVGTAGTATLTASGMNPGQTYYIQLSGNTGQSGAFTMSVNAFQDCSGCNVGNTFTVSPLPVNGMYQPGQTVQFCYHVSDYIQTNTNWLHGVQVSLGSGWNAASITATPPASCYTTTPGVWAWYPSGITDAQGTAWPMGFYYDSPLGASCACLDGNPGNNYGDDCSGTVSAGTWVFCINVTVKTACNPGADLSVAFNTSGDGESGIWINSGCVSDATTNFNAVQACCPPTVTSTSVLCNGASTAVLTATATTGAAGSQAPYTFSWTGAAAQTNTVNPGTTNTFSNVPAGTYTITVTDKNLCASTATVTVTQPAALTATVTPTNATCTSLGSISTTVSGGTSPYTYAWNGPSGYNSTAQSPSGLSAGTYTLIITDHNNCTITKTTTITQTGSITVSVNSPSTCPSSTVALTASGATTYSWIPAAGLSATTGSSVTANVATTTSYTVIGTTGSCTNSAVAVVTVTGNPPIAVTNTTICSLTKVTLTASGATTYTWSANEGGETVATVTVQPAVTTQYTVTGSVGTCTAMAVATVSVVPNPTIAVTSTAICSGGTGVLTASGATTYTWNTGPTGANLSASPTTTTQYTVTGTTSNCTATAVGTISVTPTPTVTVNNPSICSGAAASLTAAGATTYTWSSGGSANPTSVSPGVTTTYTVTGANGTCTSTAVSTVSVTPTPTVTANSATICVGQGTATLTANGATSYTWNPGGVTNPLTVSPASTTSYTVTGANGTCTNTAVVNVTVNTLPVIAVTTPTICSGNSTTISASGASSYTWSANAGSVTTSTASVTPPGNTTYTVTGINANNCTNTAVGTVSVSASVTVSVNNPIICAGSSATLTASGATSYTWDTGSNAATVTVSPVTTTVYTVTGSQNGCTGIQTSSVTVVSNPTVIVNPATICTGSSTTLTANGSSTYTWTPATGLSATTGSVVVANPTSTTVYTITGAAGTCTAVGTTTVTVNPLPTITVNTSTICVGQQTATLTANGASTYTWTPAINIAPTVGNPALATPTVTQAYTVTGTDGNGCINTATTTVTVNPLPVITVNTATICVGQQTATLTANGASTYTWTPNINLSSTNGSPVQATPTSTQNYTVTGTDANGCVNTASTTVTVNPLPTITTTSGTICIGQGTTVISANGASTYSWTPSATLNPSTGSSVVANPTVTTNYTVTGTDANGCVSTGTSTVTVNPLPIITVNTATICGGQQTATLTANGASTYTWGPSVTPTVGNPVTASPATTQSYSLTGTDANGCTNTATTTVTVNAASNISVTSAAICLGQQTATLTASGGSTYTWTPNLNLSSTNGSTVAATPQSTQVYTVTSTDINGCTNGNTATVTVNAIPNVTATSTSVCPTVTGTLTAAGAASYTWNTGSQGSSFTDAPAATTQYTVTGVDLNTCTNTAVGTILVYPSPVVTVNNATVCAAGQQTATLTANGAATYTWFPSFGLDAYSGSIVHTTSSAVTVVYIVTGTSAIGSCTAVASSTLIVNALPTPTITSNSPVCLNNPLTLTCTPAGLSSYSWAGPGTLVGSTTATPSITATTANSAGIYTVTVADNNVPFACINSTTVNVVVNPLPVITASVAPVCENQTISLFADGGVSYSWSGPGTPAFSSTLQNPTIPNATTANAGNYVVLATDANGCQSGNVAQAIVYTLPVVTVNTSTICAGQQTATLTANGASTYVWSAGTNPSSGNTVLAAPSVLTNYTVTGTDANGCVNTATTSVTVLPLPTVSTNTVATDCVPLCTTFTATSNPAASSYNWSLGNGQTSTSANPATCYTVAGTHAVNATITDINGCVATATTLVTALANPVANFDYSPQPVSILAPDVQFTNLSTPGLPNHSWDFGDTTITSDTSTLYQPSHMYNAPGNYTVTLVVSTASGCADTISKVVVIEEDYVLYVPNAFSPNGDNTNDIFLPVGEGIKDYKLYIFDRWGLLIYYTEDITKGWNGTYQAKGSTIVQEDVYVWKIDVINVLNTPKHLSGTVTLIK